MAAGLVASDPQAGAANLTASVVANFSATATLERIKLFEGAPENLGPEITDFTIVSRSGVDYNQYIESAAPPVICDTDQDRDVDLVDLQRIRAANRMAADEDDPRDGNGDGRINVADVRFCQLRLTPSQ